MCLAFNGAGNYLLVNTTNMYLITSGFVSGTKIINGDFVNSTHLIFSMNPNVFTMVTTGRAILWTQTNNIMTAVNIWVARINSTIYYMAANSSQFHIGGFDFSGNHLFRSYITGSFTNTYDYGWNSFNSMCFKIFEYKGNVLFLNAGMRNAYGNMIVLNPVTRTIS